MENTGRYTIRQNTCPWPSYTLLDHRVYHLWVEGFAERIDQSFQGPRSFTFGTPVGSRRDKRRLTRRSYKRGIGSDGSDRFRLSLWVDWHREILHRPHHSTAR